MIKLIANWVVNALALYIVSRILSGVQLVDFWSALLAVVVIGFINALLKPVFILLTLPINILTLGLFTFVVNALLFLLASALTPGFKVDGFLTALLGSILFSVISMVFHAFVK